jgi:hydrogenase expression/formation protein HypE
VEDRLLPVTPDVRGVCELLGLDPIHVANEGTMAVAVPQGQANLAIDALRQVPETAQAVCIGHVERRKLAGVVVQRGSGQQIPLDEPVGAPLPRIC